MIRKRPAKTVPGGKGPEAGSNRCETTIVGESLLLSRSGRALGNGLIMPAPHNGQRVALSGTMP